MVSISISLSCTKHLVFVLSYPCIHSICSTAISLPSTSTSPSICWSNYYFLYIHSTCPICTDLQSSPHWFCVNYLISCFYWFIFLEVVDHWGHFFYEVSTLSTRNLDLRSDCSYFCYCSCLTLKFLLLLTGLSGWSHKYSLCCCVLVMCGYDCCFTSILCWDAVLGIEHYWLDQRYFIMLYFKLYSIFLLLSLFYLWTSTHIFISFLIVTFICVFVSRLIPYLLHYLYLLAYLYNSISP